MPITTPTPRQQSYTDPAFDPNREILGSQTLGSVASGSDAFATEMSKLGNGFFNTLATAVGADNAAKLFANNVKVTADFQDHIAEAHPAAAKIGKWAALGDIGILTAPILGNSLGASLASGVGGGLVSSAGSEGSNPGEAPNMKNVLGIGLATGLVGGAASRGLVGAIEGNGLSSIANAATRQAAKVAAKGLSRGVEGGIEGIDPNDLIKKSN